MAKRGTKVADLAREMNITSRELIDHCRANGLSVQNRITKLTDEQVNRVRKMLTTDDEIPPKPQ